MHAKGSGGRIYIAHRTPEDFSIHTSSWNKGTVPAVSCAGLRPDEAVAVYLGIVGSPQHIKTV